MLIQGFQVHHIDGDHSNDAPDNLVLIEGADHLMLHGANRLKILPPGVKRSGPTKKQLQREKDQQEFAMRKQTWLERKA